MNDEGLALLERMASSHPYLVLFIVSLPSATAALAAIGQILSKLSEVVEAWRGKGK